MGIQAVYGYIEALIEQQGLNASDVQQRAGLRTNYLWRLAQGEIKEPGAATLAALIREAGGDFHLAFTLLLAPNATKDDGRRCAATKAAADAKAPAGASDMPQVPEPEQFRHLVATIAASMQDDPMLLDFLEGAIAGRLSHGSRHNRRLKEPRL